VGAVLTRMGDGGTGVGMGGPSGPRIELRFFLQNVSLNRSDLRICSDGVVALAS